MQQGIGNVTINDRKITHEVIRLLCMQGMSIVMAMVLFLHGDRLQLWGRLMLTSPNPYFTVMVCLIMISYLLLNSLSVLGLWLDHPFGCPMAILAVMSTTATLAISYWPGLFFFLRYFHVSPATHTTWLFISNGSCLAFLFLLACWRGRQR